MEGRNRSKYILSALFDVRPVNQAGGLDVAKVKQVKSLLNLKGASAGTEAKIFQNGNVLSSPRKTAYLGTRNFRTPGEMRSGGTGSLAPRKAGSSPGYPAKQKAVKKCRSSENYLPSKEEILSELDKIDRYDSLLEHFQFAAVNKAPKKRLKKRKKIVRPRAAVIPLKSIARPVQFDRSYPDTSEQKEKTLKQTSEQNNQEQTLALAEFYFPEVASVDSQDYFKTAPGPGQRKIKSDFKKLFSRPLVRFLISGFLVALIVPSAALLGQGIEIKEDVLANSLSAYSNLLSAQKAVGELDWQTAQDSFQLARFDFKEAQKAVQRVGDITLGILEKLPGGSKVSSGAHLVKLGEHLAQAGENLTKAFSLFSFDSFAELIRLPDDSSQNFLTQDIALSQDYLVQGLDNIQLAQEELACVDADALPKEVQQAILTLQQSLPPTREILEQFLDYTDDFLELLGHNNPRQYLLVFQNNSEMRATGGFIGSYGLLSLDRGAIKRLFVEGVFNADGQLHEKVVPPRPIQKISTAWSMHDANWFADFPTSAEKITWFYEKTGGPTVDGVIAVTPTVMERLLTLTGPIAMPEYELVLDKDNFVEMIQYEVEIGYDKITNRPKQILADFTPKFIKALSNLSQTEKTKALQIIFNCLKEKHVLVYFKNPELEKMAVEEGWAGEILSTEKDYLSVVSSNINGFKTDKMIKEEISHQAEIQGDGRVMATLRITRSHLGGQTRYDWWNQVNADYLRVYLPKGVKLISAQGQTLESYKAPLNYEESNFKKDSLVDSTESKMTIDKASGTHIFEENNKTVFGNWVYVSPGQTVTLEYKYELPFRIDLTKGPDTYSLLAQKQSGSLGSEFSHTLSFPESWRVSLKHPQEANLQKGNLSFRGNLKNDRFLGVTFDK